jgi:hypothetical protein
VPASPQQNECSATGGRNKVGAVLRVAAVGPDLLAARLWGKQSGATCKHSADHSQSPIYSMIACRADTSLHLI